MYKKKKNNKNRLVSFNLTYSEFTAAAAALIILIIFFFLYIYATSVYVYSFMLVDNIFVVL